MSLSLLSTQGHQRPGTRRRFSNVQEPRKVIGKRKGKERSGRMTTMVSILHSGGFRVGSSAVIRGVEMLSARAFKGLNKTIETVHERHQEIKDLSVVKRRPVDDV
jgi:hypothetical protein